MLFHPEQVFLKEAVTGKNDVSLDAAQETDPTVRKWQIVCSACSQVITGDSERISINGSHEHTFANPQGIIFQIGCFASAAGCVQVGAATDQWSWFKGYYWKIVCCSICHSHLGWAYLFAGEVRFYGFILSRLSRLH